MQARIVVIALGLGLFTACQPPDDVAVDAASTDASLLLRPCTPEQFSHRGTRKDFQCGSLAVLENPEQADGRRIELNIVRLPALSSSPQPDPVFVLAGGPGQASTEIVSAVSPWMRLVNRDRDVIFVDQRGTGQSNPLDCGEDIEPDYTLTEEQQLARQEQILKACLESYQADLRYYTTPYAADDINAVREALGYPQMNLWGGSYGTRLALEIMRRHGDTVRSAVLDGAAPVGINLPGFTLRDADAAMAKIIALCENNPQCNERYPDLRQTLQQLIRRYDQNPTQVTLTHPLRGEEFSLRLNGQSIAGLLRLGLYTRDIAPNLPLIIDAAGQENFAPLLTLMSMAEATSSSVSAGLQQTILCVEDIARVEGTDNTSDSLLQLEVIEPSKTVCEYWPEGKLPEHYFEPVKSDIPTLILSGEFDPVTPARWGDRVAANLSQHLHITVPGAHHGASRLGCVPDIIDQFYTDLLQQPLATECVDNIVPMPPFASPAGPSMRATESNTKNNNDTGN